MPIQYAISNLPPSKHKFSDQLVKFYSLSLTWKPLRYISWPDEHTLGTYPNDPKFSKRLGFFQKLQKMAVWGFAPLKCHLSFGGIFGYDWQHIIIGYKWPCQFQNLVRFRLHLQFHEMILILDSGNQWPFKKKQLPLGWLVDWCHKRIPLQARKAARPTAASTSRGSISVGVLNLNQASTWKNRLETKHNISISWIVAFGLLGFCLWRCLLKTNLQSCETEHENAWNIEFAEQEVNSNNTSVKMCWRGNRFEAYK